MRDIPMKLTDRKRADIVQAAVEIFAETGFDAASMDAIAAAANVSKRTIYNHFASKDDLFLAIVQQLKDASQAAANLDSVDDLPLPAQLASLGMAVVNFHCRVESRRLAKVILPRLLQQPGLGAELFGGGKLFEAELVKWFKSAVASGQMRKMECRQVAIQFLGMLEAFVVWPQLIRNSATPGPAARQKFVESAVQMVMSNYQS